MGQPITESEIWRQLFALADKCQPIVTKYTVCIYALHGSLRPAGTGVLLQVEDTHFIVSAAHVMDLTFYRGLQFYASVTTGTATLPLPLQFVKRDSSARPKHIPTDSPGLRNGDSLDFSIAELDADTAAKLSERYRFLQVAQLDPSPLRTAAGILVFGYPAALTESHDQGVELESFPLAYVTTPLEDGAALCDTDKDILLYYRQQSSDRMGGPRTAPEPIGLSGCGIWRICQPPVLPNQTNTDDIRLVGIPVRWNADKQYLIGTSVSYLLELICLSRPDLRKALRQAQSV